MAKDQMIKKEYEESFLDGKVIARLEKHGIRFEIIVPPDIVESVKGGEDVELHDHIASETVFADAKKGERVPDDDIIKAFGTLDIEEIGKKLILEGNVQMTADQRKKLLDMKKKQIVNYIARNAINPQTRAPHPPQRIEIALEEVGFHVDPFMSVDAQVTKVMERLRPVIPIRFEKVKMAIKVPGQEYGAVYGLLKDMGSMQKEEWQADGSWICVIEIPAGIQTDLMEQLGAKTKGQADTKIVK